MNETPITISCQSCVMQHTDTCADCVVTFMCQHESAHVQPPDDAIVFDIAEQRAVRLLAAAGLVPTLRHREVIQNHATRSG